MNAPTAHNVQLAASFTAWQEKAIDLHQNGEGDWEVDVDLKPGKHYYRFLVDGEWRDDPDCPFCVENGYGGHNAVCEVR